MGTVPVLMIAKVFTGLDSMESLVYNRPEGASRGQIREELSMRILLLTQIVVLPADSGPKIKTLQVLKHLAAHHDIVNCTFAHDAREVQYAEKLGALCSRVVTVPMRRSPGIDARFLLESLVTGDSFILRRDERTAMRAAVARLLREEHFDAVHVDQLNMMRFLPKEWKGAVILDEHNAVWQVVERLRKRMQNPMAHWFLGREIHVVRKQESAACQRAQVVLTVSEQDRQALRAIAGEAAAIEIVPISVDAQNLAPVCAARRPQRNRLLTIGTMFWPPNSEGAIWWLREGYEYLRSECTDVIYDIVGARPPRALQRLASRHPGVRLHGYVADALPFWKETSALAVPLLSGGGVRVKILEAMAMGVPVISTTMGCEGLDVRSGEHLLVADTPQAFASACASVLQDADLAHRLTENARRLILENYDKEVALQALDSVYERIGASIAKAEC